MKADKYQELALKTWYSEDNPLYLDPRHPLIKLAGEAGELLDLYGKHEYKPRFDWWKCKICNFMPAEKRRSEVDYFAYTCMNDKSHNPLVLDELGDLWYYLRIVTWQQNWSIEEWIRDYNPTDNVDILDCLAEINKACAKVLVEYLDCGNIGVFEKSELLGVYQFFAHLLKHLDCSIDQLTDLNYNKLNSEPTAHGWKT